MRLTRFLLIVMCMMSLGSVLVPREAQAGIFDSGPRRIDPEQDRRERERRDRLQGPLFTIGLSFWTTVMVGFVGAVTGGCVDGVSTCAHRGVFYLDLLTGAALGSSVGMMVSKNPRGEVIELGPVITGAVLGAATGVAMSHTIYTLTHDFSEPELYFSQGYLWVLPTWTLSIAGAYLGQRLGRRAREAEERPRYARAHEVMWQSGVSLGLASLYALSASSADDAYEPLSFQDRSGFSFFVLPILTIGSVQGIGAWNRSGGKLYGTFAGVALGMVAVQIPAMLLQGDACGPGRNPDTCDFMRPARIAHMSLLGLSSAAGAVLGYQLSSRWGEEDRGERGASNVRIPDTITNVSLGVSPLLDGGAMGSVGFRF